MAVLMDQCLYLAVPKTGSQWCHRVLCRHAGGRLVRSRRGNARHLQLNEATVRWPSLETGEDTPRYFSANEAGERWPDRAILCFVRHPLAWLTSFYRYRRGRGWKDNFPLDECRADTLEGFIDRYLDNNPGFVSWLYGKFTGPEDDPVAFIGRQERLCEDALTALDRFGQDHDAQRIRAMAGKTVNPSRFPAPPELDEDRKQAVLDAEREAMERYGYDQ